jgi:hypothetical protein
MTRLPALPVDEPPFTTSSIPNTKTDAPTNNCVANADTGTSGNYMGLRDCANLINVQLTDTPVTVTLPDGSTAISTHTALLNLPILPLACRLVHIFPQWHAPLLSIGLLCDAGMIAIYTAANVLILDRSGNLVLHGSRSPINKIWLIDVSGPPPSSHDQPKH